MDNRVYASRHGGQPWPFPGSNQNYPPTLSAAVPPTAYGMAYNGSELPVGSGMLPMAAYGTPGYGYPVSAYLPSAGGPEDFDSSWYQGEPFLFTQSGVMHQ